MSCACKEKTSYYCAQCSTINRAPPHTIVAICAPGQRSKKRKVRAEDADTELSKTPTHCATSNTFTTARNKQHHKLFYLLWPAKAVAPTEFGRFLHVCRHSETFNAQKGEGMNKETCCEQQRQRSIRRSQMLGAVRHRKARARAHSSIAPLPPPRRQNPTVNTGTPSHVGFNSTEMLTLRTRGPFFFSEKKS